MGNNNSMPNGTPSSCCCGDSGKCCWCCCYETNAEAARKLPKVDLYPSRPWLSFSSKLVLDRINHHKLAPIQQGLNPLSYKSSTISAAASSSSNDDDNGNENSTKKINIKTVFEECPICFLTYNFVNKTKCCGQSICTECFLQMCPHLESSNKTCPFCNAIHFNVVFNEDFSETTATNKQQQQKQQQKPAVKHQKTKKQKS